MASKCNPFSVTLSQKLKISSGVLALILTLFTVSFSMAESWYVKPSAEIPLRRGQGTEFKIDAILPYGAEVEILEEDGGWVRVMTANGQEGWMLKRYLGREKPLRELVDSLRQENALLKEGKSDMTEKTEEMATHNEQLQEELDSCAADLSRTREDFLSLQKDTADVVRIKEELSANQDLVKSLHQELNTAMVENEKLKDNQKIKWFLAGGGTLIFGCIVGMMISRSRRRKPSLY
ncbi:MAG: TIGR04211 family SH3 domain-containing protein [Desulforhopalus sp.]